ncbi:MAG: hypothetical protein ACO3DM_12235, partial [Ilumatobacteraceae bacterium]
MNRQQRETILAGVVGAVLAGLTGRILGVGRWATVVGLTSGLIVGRRGVYDWRSRRGVIAFVADHTWALSTTTSGLIAMGANRLTDAGYEPSLSHRQNRMVYRRGFVLRRGFAVTFGNVVNGAADEHGELTERRRTLVTVHEDAHVRQARMFGPIYPLVYGAWFVGGTLVGATKWLMSDRSVSLSRMVDVDAYYRNPFERHAYTLQGVSTP